MTLYEIKQELADLVDEDTGEIKDMSAFEKACADKEEKLTNIGLLAKNKNAEIKILKEEEERLKRRRQAAEKTVKWCKATLKIELNGAKFEDERKRVSVYYHTSQAVKIEDFAEIPSKFKRDFTDEERLNLVDKERVKQALIAGENIKGCVLEERQSLCIK